MSHVEKVTLLLGKQCCNLYKIENNAGDVYYRIRARTYMDGKRECFTVIEFSSHDLAMSEFLKMTGG